MLDASSTASGDATQAAKRRRKRPTIPPTQGKQLRRINELHRLADYRDHHHTPLGDTEPWTFLLAEACRYHTKGFDLFTFRDVKHPALDISDDEAVMAMHWVECIVTERGPEYRPTSAAKAGKMLGLTEAERRLCDIRTMRSIDGETPAQRATRYREEDRKRKRERRKRASAAAKQAERKRGRRRRATIGARSHAESFSQTRPWEAEGMSRRTWERRRRVAKTSTPPPCRKNVRPSHPSWRGTDEFASNATAGSNGHRLGKALTRTGRTESSAPKPTPEGKITPDVIIHCPQMHEEGRKVVSGNVLIRETVRCAPGCEIDAAAMGLAIRNAIGRALAQAG